MTVRRGLNKSACQGIASTEGSMLRVRDRKQEEKTTDDQIARTITDKQTLTGVALHLLLGRMRLVGEILVLLLLCRVLAVGLVLGGMLPVLAVLAVLGMLAVLAVCRVRVLAVLGVRAMLGEVLSVGRVVGRVRGVGERHLATAVGDVVGVRVSDAVLVVVRVGADGAAGGVLVRAGGVGLLGRLRGHSHQTCEDQTHRASYKKCCLHLIRI